MGTVAVIAVLLILLAWFFWPSKSAPRRHDDNAELDVAEREVQEAPDEETVRDWGPGTGQKPLP
jgi:hypothetical protein